MDLKTRNLEGNIIMESVLRKHVSATGNYTETGWNSKIEVASGSSRDGKQEVGLGSQSPGSYCVMFTVKKDDGVTTIMQVPYYFVIKSTE